MIDAASLPDRPGRAVDVDDWSFHHRVLYRLVLGASGSRTVDLQLLYEALAPVLYRGVVDSPCESRRWRRELLGHLRDAGVVAWHPTPRGWVWTPAADVLEGDLPGQAKTPCANEPEAVGGESHR